MQYFIREWADQTATLIAEDGYALSDFDSIDDAIDACIEDCLVEPEWIESYFNYLGSSPMDYDATFLDS